MLPDYSSDGWRTCYVYWYKKEILQAEETLIYRNLEDPRRFENTLCGCIQENIEVVAIYNIDFSGAENEFMQLILEVVQTRALKMNFVNCVIPPISLRKKKQVKLGPLAYHKLRLLYSLGLVNCKFIGNRGESIVNLWRTINAWGSQSPNALGSGDEECGLELAGLAMVDISQNQFTLGEVMFIWKKLKDFEFIFVLENGNDVDLSEIDSNNLVY